MLHPIADIPNIMNRIMLYNSHPVADMIRKDIYIHSSSIYREMVSFFKYTLDKRDQFCRCCFNKIKINSYTKLCTNHRMLFREIRFFDKTELKKRYIRYN